MARDACSKGAIGVRESQNTLDLFQGYDWPGNIRELQNVVERAVVLCDGDIFCVDPSWLAPASLHPTTQAVPLVADLAERERAMIENALRAAEGLISGPNGAAAKAYVSALGQALHFELKDRGVHVTVLTPGFIDTPVIPKLLEDPGALPMKPMSAEKMRDRGARSAASQSRCIHSRATQSNHESPRSSVGSSKHGDKKCRKSSPRWIKDAKGWVTSILLAILVRTQ